MTAPVTLAIDTARDRLQLALLLGDGRIDTHTEPVSGGHAEIVMDRIGALLARNGLLYAGLDRITVSTGPGSFTGLRIGLSVARGLGLALAVPVVGVPTLVALSLAREGAHEIVLDARRGQAYRQAFSAPGVPGGEAELIDAGDAGETDSAIDIARLATFAAAADPRDFPPEPSYLRPADAKPQLKGKVARR